MYVDTPYANSLSHQKQSHVKNIVLVLKRSYENQRKFGLSRITLSLHNSQVTVGRGQITRCPAIDELISAFYSYMDNEHARKSALELISRQRGDEGVLGSLS